MSQAASGAVLEQAKSSLLSIQRHGRAAAGMSWPPQHIGSVAATDMHPNYEAQSSGCRHIYYLDRKLCRADPKKLYPCCSVRNPRESRRCRYQGRYQPSVHHSWAGRLPPKIDLYIDNNLRCQNKSHSAAWRQRAAEGPFVRFCRVSNSWIVVRLAGGGL
jgi:hypothetical protein